jgi:zinc transport system substrate-binding protein
MFKNLSTQMKITIVIASIFIIFGTSALILNYRSKANKEANDPNAVKISASFYPLYYITQKITGGNDTVTNITPAGSEPHEYEPTTVQIRDIYESKLFVFNGAGLDPWADKIQENLGKTGVKTVNMSSKFNILNSVEASEKGNQDPHIWLSPSMYKQQVEVIRDQLVTMTTNSTNKNIYNNNADLLLKDLTKLETEFKTRLSKCDKKEIMTSHDFLQYLARDYGFSVVSINGLSPDREPSSLELAETTKLIRDKKIKYIFTETLASPKLAQTIAAETGAQNLILNPLEGLTKDEIDSGKDYISIQKENLESLTKGLECR